MTTLSGRDNIKNVLGQIPFTAELYWLVRQKGKPLQSRFSLKHLQAAMPELVRRRQPYCAAGHSLDAIYLSLRRCIIGSNTPPCSA
jgi:hypothetical protein